MLVELNNIKRTFLLKVKWLRTFLPSNAGANTDVSSNLKLKTAANRITVPLPFETFISFIEESTKTEFPSNLTISKDEVRASDLDQFSKYSKFNSDFSKIKLDYLILAGKQAANELYLFRSDKQKHRCMYNLEDVADSYPQTTSSCFPDFKPKGDPEARANAISIAQSYLNQPKLSNLFGLVTVVFHRFQYKVSLKGELSKKIRQVWGIAYPFSIIEGYYFRNLIDYAAKSNSLQSQPSTTWGLNLPEVSDRIITPFRTYSNRLVSLDLKSFDSTVPAFMWALFFCIIENSIHFRSEVELKGFRNLMYFYVYTPYVYGNCDTVQYQKGGIASGSLVTNLFGTWVNRTIINYAFLEYTRGKYTPKYKFVVLGDDNLIADEILPESYYRSVYSRFGMTVSLEKSDFVASYDNVSFLGCIWDALGRPIQEENWYIAHFALPSRFLKVTTIPLAYLQTYRALSISMIYHGGFSMFKKLIGFKDVVYKRLLSEFLDTGNDPLIPYVGEDQRLVNLRVPFSAIISGDWRYFANSISLAKSM